MTCIDGARFDEERALYGSRELTVRNCAFDGPADGESALKESRDITAEHCYFNLRYPFWHVHGLKITDSEMTPLCRAAMWYSDHIEISDSKLLGIKALRECAEVSLQNCRIDSPEFGWSVDGLAMADSSAVSEYFMMRSRRLRFERVQLSGKYSFQYIEDAVFDHCVFDTKDAFWHSRQVTVRDSVIKGEYLGWYSEGLTLEHCRIIGTQPLCYCKGLRLIDCEMENADLCFERSEVEAVVTTPILSIKNPLSGHIYAPRVDTLIRDDPAFQGVVTIV